MQGEITSYLALGNYQLADERQQYLYRVQSRSMQSGPSRAAALMQQAQWQYRAYTLGLGEKDYTRLISMWDMYRLALTDIMSHQGETDPALVPPLRGMLRAQYLIAGYDEDSLSSAGADDLGTHRDINRFYAYRTRSYDNGQIIINAIYRVGLDEDGNSKHPADTARTLTMLGDWQMWHARRKAARRSYQEALAELARTDNAEVQAERLFGHPVPLPDIDGLRPLPPSVNPDVGDVVLQFSVDELGRVRNLSRLDDHEDVKANRLIRTLRKTIFRPRLEAGEPVRTDNIVTAYDIN